MEKSSPNMLQNAIHLVGILSSYVHFYSNTNPFICTHLGGVSNVSHMNSHIYMNYKMLQNIIYLNFVRILLFLAMCICIQIQIINMHTSRGSLPHTLKYLANIIIETSILLQIIVLSSNTKKGEIERTSPEFTFLILVLCVS